MIDDEPRPVWGYTRVSVFQKPILKSFFFPSYNSHIVIHA